MTFFVAPLRARKEVRRAMAVSGLDGRLGHCMLTKYRLRRMEDLDYAGVFSMVQQARLQGETVKKIKVRSLRFMRSGDYTKAPPDMSPYVRGSILDLRDYFSKNGTTKDQFRDIFDVYAEAKAEFSRLLGASTTGTQEVFEAVDALIRKLNFKSSVVWVPVGDVRGTAKEEHWARRFVSSKWEQDGETQYPPEGAPPKTTLEGILTGPKDVYIVNVHDWIIERKLFNGFRDRTQVVWQALSQADYIKECENWRGILAITSVAELSLPGLTRDEVQLVAQILAKFLAENSFIRNGLTPDLKSIENDLTRSKGPGGMIFLRITSPTSKAPSAVVQIHNRIDSQSDDASIEDPLPKDQAEVSRIISILLMIFSEAMTTFLEIQRRTEP